MLRPNLCEWTLAVAVSIGCSRPPPPPLRVVDLAADADRHADRMLDVDIVESLRRIDDGGHTLGVEIPELGEDRITLVPRRRWIVYEGEWRLGSRRPRFTR